MVVDQSRNGTFLHRRDYMDYHADRFEDMVNHRPRRLGHRTS